MEHEEFIGEAIKPLTATLNALCLVGGEPAMPGKFLWRGEEFEVAAVLEKWKTTGECKSGSGELYVRKHWFRVRTALGEEMKIYFERQARSARQRKMRWWLYSTKSEGGSGSR